MGEKIKSMVKFSYTCKFLSAFFLSARAQSGLVQLSLSKQVPVPKADLGILWLLVKGWCGGKE